MELTRAQALGLRMRSLLLREPPATASPPADGPAGRGPAWRGVAGVVEWFGAMQAQDYGSILWSLGCRLPASTRAGVESALADRAAVRTWPMRGTIHLVPARDARWLVELLAARPIARAAARREQLGLSPETVGRAIDVLGEALSGGRRLTRGACADVLEQAGIPTDGQRAYHLLAHASQRAVTCLGPTEGTEQTFVLLDEWVPDPHRPDREEALATLAVRYFRSHGPTTRQDLAGWAGLAAADARHAVALAGGDLEAATLDGREVYLAAGTLDTLASDRLSPPDGAAEPRVDLLAGFDEYLLGYKDRSLMLDAGAMAAVVPGRNGVFRWTVARDGRVAATWQRARRGSGARARTEVTVLPLSDLDEAGWSAIEAALQAYAGFTERPVTLCRTPSTSATHAEAQV